MSNSVTAFIFSIVIATIAISTSSSLSILNRSINKSILKIERLIEDSNYIEETISHINQKKELKDIIDGDISITFTDLSSKIDLNFIDFTIFSKKGFNSMLDIGITWKDLEEFRNNLGFTADIELYRSFFKPSLEFENLFTVYSLPNINSMSDIMLERYYIEVTSNESKGHALKNYIQSRRLEKKPIDTRDLKRLTTVYGDSLTNFLTTTPSWNKKNLNKMLLSYTNNLTKEALKLYIGEKTSFYRASIVDKTLSTVTTLIFRWIESEDRYKPISITKELL